MTVRSDKQDVVRDLSSKMEQASSIILSDYRGLNVAEVTELRRMLREAGVEFRVVKNTLMRRAAEERGLGDLEPHLVGPTAVAFGGDDPVAPARVLVKFAKGSDHVNLKIGVLQGSIIELDDIMRLGALPDRQQLLSQVAGTIAAPLRNMAYLFKAPVQDLVYGLKALADQKA